MTTSRASLSLLFAASLSLALPARAALDAYMKIDGVNGHSLDPQHMGWIEISSAQFDQIRSSVPAGGPARGAAGGKIHLSEITISKRTDASSPLLLEAATKGRHFPEVIIEMRKAGGGPQEYLVIRMSDALVSSYQMGGKGGAPPTDSFTLTFRGAEFVNKEPANARLSAVSAAGSAVVGASHPPTITAASASAPVVGLGVTVTIKATAPCVGAFVDYGDGSIVEGQTLTGTSTTLAPHTYPSPGAKTIKVGGRDAPYWTGPKKATPARPNDCAGWAPVVNVTLRNTLAPAPVIAR